MASSILFYRLSETLSERVNGGSVLLTSVLTAGAVDRFMVPEGAIDPAIRLSEQSPLPSPGTPDTAAEPPCQGWNDERDDDRYVPRGDVEEEAPGVLYGRDPALDLGLAEEQPDSPRHVPSAGSRDDHSSTDDTSRCWDPRPPAPGPFLGLRLPVSRPLELARGPTGADAGERCSIRSPRPPAPRPLVGGDRDPHGSSLSSRAVASPEESGEALPRRSGHDPV